LQNITRTQPDVRPICCFPRPSLVHAECDELTIRPVIGLSYNPFGPAIGRNDTEVFRLRKLDSGPRPCPQRRLHRARAYRWDADEFRAKRTMAWAVSRSCLSLQGWRSPRSKEGEWLRDLSPIAMRFEGPHLGHGHSGKVRSVAG
jgi:hypothetical protein